MVGISQPSLANIESGKTNPRIITAKRIAAVLDFDWTKFFEKS
jgi:DNA-binding XRE family transcriptional regulator